MILVLEFIIICLLIYALYRLGMYISFRVNDQRSEARLALKEGRKPVPYKVRNAKRKAELKAEKLQIKAAKQGSK